MSHSEESQRKIEDLHDGKIRDARGDLWEHLNAARDSLKSAINSHYSLSAGNAFDVEYEGNTEFGRHLEETLRLLTITRALMPTTSSTDTVDPEFAETVRALMGGSHLTR